METVHCGFSKGREYSCERPRRRRDNKSPGPTQSQTGSVLKTLGIIGGVGPESTVDYYQSIIEIFRKRKPEAGYPQLIINSINLDTVRGLVETGDFAALVNHLVEELRKLERAGVDFGLIAANTPHLVFDDLKRESPLPLLSIVEATRDAARARGMKRLALFGTRFTMQARFYPDVFSRAGIEIVAPNLPDQDYIHDKYMNELVNGVFLPETRAGLLAVVDRVKETSGVDGVILGGTELPLILRESAYEGIPLLNTTKIHVEAAVDHMLS
jgi:aspartate racemase